MPDRLPLWAYLLAALAVSSAAALIERRMGRLPISKSGRVLLWGGPIYGPENSQQLVDWYSFTHILHGCILYALIRLVGGAAWPCGACLLLAVVIEASWEVLENSPFIINRYRQTAAHNYYGDSILNSMSDILFCVLGFYLADILPVWTTTGLVVATELALAWLIRDNLTLNILMLLHPFPAIKRWQTGSH